MSNKISLKRNVFFNALKQCCSVILPLFTFSYVSRTLGKEQYGVYSFSLSVVGYFVLFAGLGINTYSVREGARIRNLETIDKFCSEVFSINVFSSIISYTLLLILVYLIPKFQIYKWQISVLSLGILFSTVGMDWVNSIYEDYFFLTVRYITIQIITLSLVLIFVKDENDLDIYCWISLFTLYGGYLLNIFHVKKYVCTKFIPKINLEHLKPILTLFVNTLATTVYVNSDIIMMGFYCSTADVGLYAFSTRLYNSAKSILNSSVIVTIPRLASVVNEDIKLYHIYIKKIVSGVCFALFPSIAFLFIMRREIILIMAGADYLDSSYSFAILSITIPFAILSSIIANDILIVNRLEYKCLFSTSITAIVNIALNLFLLPMLGIIGASITTLIAELANLLLQGFFALKVLSLNRIIDKEMFIYCSEVLIVFFTKSALNKVITTCNGFFDTSLFLILNLMIDMLIYFILLYCTKNSILFSLINHKKKFIYNKCTIF